MRLTEAIRVAWEALRANKLRSGLTMLGVVIGVASVVLLVAIGSGARDEVTSGVESLGSNILFVAPGNLSFGSAPSVSSTTRIAEYVSRLTVSSPPPSTSAGTT